MFFILALLAFFAIALPDAMLGVSWPFMRVTFDQPLTAMTLVLPFGVAATVVSTSSWTWAAARLGLGRMLAGSIALSAVALLCCALAPAYWVIVFCAVLFGLLAVAIDAALNSYAARHFGPRQINFMHAAYGIGAATSPLIVTVVVSAGTSWRWAYLVVMIIQGALAVLFAFSSRRWNEAAGKTSNTSTATPFPSPMNRARWRPQPRAVAGLLVVAVECGLESVVGLWAFVFLLEAVALEPAIAGVVVSGYWAALVARPCAARLGGRASWNLGRSGCSHHHGCHSRCADGVAAADPNRRGRSRARTCGRPYLSTAGAHYR
jgi:MFS family permease